MMKHKMLYLLIKNIKNNNKTTIHNNMIIYNNNRCSWNVKNLKNWLKI